MYGFAPTKLFSITWNRKFNFLFRSVLSCYISELENNVSTVVVVSHLSLQTLIKVIYGARLPYFTSCSVRFRMCVYMCVVCNVAEIIYDTCKQIKNWLGHQKCLSGTHKLVKRNVALILWM
jgi:hypothetical protein